MPDVPKLVQTGGSSSPTKYNLIAAAIILALYALLGVTLLICSAVDPVKWAGEQWAHALTIFSAFGAMATTGASVLLGIEVQRTNVSEAQDRVQKTSEQLGALRQTHEAVLAAVNGTPAAIDVSGAQDRLNAVRAALAPATTTL